MQSVGHIDINPRHWNAQNKLPVLASELQGETSRFPKFENPQDHLKKFFKRGGDKASTFEVSLVEETKVLIETQDSPAVLRRPTHHLESRLQPSLVGWSRAGSTRISQDVSSVAHETRVRVRRNERPAQLLARGRGRSHVPVLRRSH